MTSSIPATLALQAAPNSTTFGGGHAVPGLAADNPLVALMLDNSPDCLQLLDLDGHFLFMNGPGLALLEIDDVAPLQGQPWARPPGARRNGGMSSYRRCAVVTVRRPRSCARYATSRN